MSSRSRLNIAASPEELALLRSVVPRGRLSHFVIEAAVEKARQIKRAALRQQIVDAYMADPDYLRNAGSEWDAVSLEGWPEP